MSLRRWTDRLSGKRHDVLIWKLAGLFAERITDPEVRCTFASWISSGDAHALCSYDAPYGRLSVHDSIQVRQCCALFAKRADLDLGLDRRGAAVRSFIKAELLCRETNEILRLRADGGFFFPPRVERVLHHAQRKIASILGPCPSLDRLKFRLGPGATVHVPKRRADALVKLGDPLHCSEDLLPIVGALLEELPHLVFSPEEQVDDTVESKGVTILIEDSRLDFVPKSYKTDRTIGVEPLLNTMFQLGVGDYMSNRLRKVGVDLRDQKRNQRLAREGSLTGALATLDLSSASDTVAKNLVMELLPFDWFELLSYGRSSHMVCEGVRVTQEKFSSMGNGYTFPLESLIFYALSWASSEGYDQERVSVYGDDIIVPTEAYDLLVEVLHCCGFIPNREKSFNSGPFRESCGADYHSGINIRPVYVRDRLDGPSLYVLHNHFVRSFDEGAAMLVRSVLPEHLHIYGPDGYGDGHLLGPWDPRPHGRARGYAGYTFDSFRLRPNRFVHTIPGDYVFSTYSTYASTRSIVWDEVTSIADLHDLPEMGAVEVGVSGSIQVTRPGSGREYDRIKIYTLTV